MAAPYLLYDGHDLRRMQPVKYFFLPIVFIIAAVALRPTLALGTVDSVRSLEAIAYPDHAQLLVVRNAQGQERPVLTTADWAQRAAHIRANIQQVMGPLPDRAHRAPLDVAIISEEQTKNYLRRKILFTAE
ncbi:MAG: hypothetical protein NTX39_01640, partial [Opitutae bacterium]|nr:hypothetical protein [Opitutae bacterium]